MTSATVLARAHVASTRNHLVTQLGGRLSATISLVVGLVLLLGYNVLVYFASSSLLGTVFSNPQAAALVLPVLPLVLTVPAFGIALILIMLLPVESPLALQARAIGASRWYCAVSEYGPTALAVIVASVAGLGGSFLFFSSVSSSPVLTFFALILLSAAFGTACNVLVLAVSRLLSLIRLPPREQRMWGVVAATAGLATVAVDMMRWAGEGGRPSGLSLTRLTGELWGEDLPAQPSFLVTLTVCLLALILLGAALSYSDPAGGYLRAATTLVPTPAFRKLGPQLIAIEITTWLRDSTSRVSLCAMLALDTGLVVTARSHLIDPGVIMLAFVMISATGGELIIGRSRAINWTLRALGVRDAFIFWLRIGVVGIILVLIFTIAMVTSGLTETSPERILEAYSLLVAVFAVAVLAGTLIPFDDSAALGMFATSALTLILEIAVIVTVTAVLTLTGPALIIADLTAATLGLLLAWRTFRRARHTGP